MFVAKQGQVSSIPPLPLSPVTDREVQKVWSQLLQESCRKYTFKHLKKPKKNYQNVVTG